MLRCLLYADEPQPLAFAALPEPSSRKKPRCFQLTIFSCCPPSFHLMPDFSQVLNEQLRTIQALPSYRVWLGTLAEAEPFILPNSVNVAVSRKSAAGAEPDAFS